MGQIGIGQIPKSVGSKGKLSLKEPSPDVNIAPGRPGLGAVALIRGPLRDRLGRENEGGIGRVPSVSQSSTANPAALNL